MKHGASSKTNATIAALNKPVHKEYIINIENHVLIGTLHYPIILIEVLKFIKYFKKPTH